MKTSNRKASQFVNNRQKFTGSNTFAEIRQTGKGVFYAVFSYGYHYPLFIYDGKNWFENSTKYSITTSKHRNQLRPDAPTILLNTNELKAMLYVDDLT